MGLLGSYKKIVTFLLNRVNTVTGVRYGDDPTILAWQTGNELNYPDPLIPGRLGPPPGKWTGESRRAYEQRVCVLNPVVISRNSDTYQKARPTHACRRWLLCKRSPAY